MAKKKTESLYPELIGRTIRRKMKVHYPEDEGGWRTFEAEYKIGHIKETVFDGFVFIDILADTSVCEDSLIVYDFEKLIKERKAVVIVEDDIFEQCHGTITKYELI